MKRYTDHELFALRDRHESWLMSQEGVTGTGIGLGRSGEPVLRIFTAGISPATQKVIVQKLAGVPLAWEEGEVVAD